MTRDSSGSLAKQTYFPYGGVRTTEGTLPTDYTFTGQKRDASDGLMYYGARYYEADIGRFVQPDSIVPNPFNPQSLNRYSYVLNNPVNYTDPTGHTYCDDHVCEGDYDLDQVIAEVQIEFGVDVSNGFTSVQAATIQHSLRDFASKVGGADAAKNALGGAHFLPNRGQLVDENGNLYTGQLKDTIYISPGHWHQQGLRKDLGPQIGIVHESAHYWDWKEGNPLQQVLNGRSYISLGMPGSVCAVGGACEKGPTAYGRTNSTEGWAEAVAMWVYPQYADILRQEGRPAENPLHRTGRPLGPGEGGPGLGGLHIQYLFKQILELGGW